MVQQKRARRSSTANNRERVELCVIGPKSIVPKTVTVETYLSNTWLKFFNDDLQLNLQLNQDIFVCNTNYCPSAPKEGEGWRCDLNEPIINYVNHFERRRIRYTVRIYRSSDCSGKYGRGSSSSVANESRTSRSQARSSTPGPNGRRAKSTPGNRAQRSRSVANARSPSPQSRQPSILIPTTSNSTSAAVLTPRAQQSRYGTRQKRLHDQSISHQDPQAPPELPSSQGIFVCNTHYCPSDPKEGEGWRCNLNEPISNYVNHFERRRNRYTVRIYRSSDCDGKYGRQSSIPSSSIANESRTSRGRSSTPGPNGRKTRSTLGNRAQRSRSVANARSPSPQHRQPSILIPTTSNSTSAAVLTPRAQQSRYGTRQKRLHDQSISHQDPQAPPEISSKRQRKQIIVPRSAEPVPGPVVLKQEVSQAEDEGPQINDVRSVLKIELPSVTLVTVNEQFYDEDDELETDVSSAEGESGSDANAFEGREEQGLLEESGDQVQQETNGRDDEVGRTSDTSEDDEEPAWARNNGDEEGVEEEDDDDDGMSMCTAVTEEEIQLRQEGIQVEDIKSVAYGRMANFSNAYMLRMKNEINKLRKNNHWTKNVEKSPLACYFLQELFKE